MHAWGISKLPWEGAVKVPSLERSLNTERRARQ